MVVKRLIQLALTRVLRSRPDVDGNGSLDLIVANSNDGTVDVLINNGNGIFQSAMPYLIGSAPQQIAFADVNGDGIPDILTANTGDETVGVLLGNGDGTYQTVISNGSGATTPTGSLGVGDVDADGVNDVVVAAGPDGNYVVLQGNGRRNFLITSYSCGMSTRYRRTKPVLRSLFSRVQS